MHGYTQCMRAHTTLVNGNYQSASIKGLAKMFSLSFRRLSTGVLFSMIPPAYLKSCLEATHMDMYNVKLYII